MTQQQAEAALRAQRTGLRARRAGLALALGLATYFWLLTFADPSWAPRTTTAYGVLLAVRDDLKEQPVSRARIAWIIGLFFSAAALMAMTAGAGG